MLCYRCGSHVPDAADTCINCGNRLGTPGRTVGATSTRRRPGGNEVPGSPYRTGNLITLRYPVADVVGQGPCGWVFRSPDNELDIDVAVKVIHPRLLQSEEERTAFSARMKMSRRFSHPSLARAYDDGVDGEDRPFFTQPFLDGLTLRNIIDQRVSKGQYFTPREVEPVLSQLVKALEAAGAQGPHANLKPSNVFIQPDLLKVTDFGLSLALPRMPFAQAQRATQAHRYLAPEYLAGFEVDRAADQYALGMMVGEMLSGLVPEDATSIKQLRSRNGELDAEFEGFYARTLAESPQARFPTLDALLAEFSRLTERSTSSARPGLGPNSELERHVSVPPPVRDRPLGDGHTSRASERGTRAASGEDEPSDATIPMSAEELAAKFGLFPTSSKSRAGSPSEEVPPPDPANTVAERSLSGPRLRARPDSASAEPSAWRPRASPGQSSNRPGAELESNLAGARPTAAQNGVGVPGEPAAWSPRARTPSARNAPLAPSPDRTPARVREDGKRGPPSRAPDQGEPPVNRPSRAALPPSELHTQAFKNLPLEFDEEPSAPPALFAGARRKSFAARPAVWMTLLILVGILLGVILGRQIWVHLTRPAAAPVPAPSHPAPTARVRSAAPVGKSGTAKGGTVGR